MCVLIQYEKGSEIVDHLCLVNLDYLVNQKFSKKMSYWDLHIQYMLENQILCLKQITVSISNVDIYLLWRLLSGKSVVWVPALLAFSCSKSKKETRLTIFGICSNITKMIPERHQWCPPGIFDYSFEQISYIMPVLPFLTLNKQMSVGKLLQPFLWK